MNGRYLFYLVLVLIDLGDMQFQTKSNHVRYKPRPLRPQLTVSDKMPLPLIESPEDYMRRPKKRHLKPDKLLQILGDNYDPNWMTIEPPRTKEAGPPTTEQNHKSNVLLLSQLRKLNFTFVDEYGKNISLHMTALRLFQDWMLRNANCPVRYEWEDVGMLFWPRFVKQGQCLNNSQCSWPKGMHCVPAESMNIYLLRWHCRPRGIRRRRKYHPLKQAAPSVIAPDKIRYKCSWLKVPYPVTAECFCSC